MAHDSEPASGVYHGIWAVLAGFFKVPRQPPTLLALEGERIESFRPGPGFLTYLRFQFWLVILAIAIGLLVLWILVVVEAPLVGVFLVPLLLLAVGLAGMIGHIALRLRYDTTWYVMSERSVRMRRGIWIIREATITFENVQNVALKQGPLQRHFGIAELVVQTAGGGGATAEKGQTNPHMGLIEGIADAARIRDVIMSRVRRSRRAGLGDERLEEIRADGRGSRWSPAHIEALRAIRGEIAALRRGGE